MNTCIPHDKIGQLSSLMFQAATIYYKGGGSNESFWVKLNWNDGKCIKYCSYFAFIRFKEIIRVSVFCK